jgi:hypothetical protein
MLVSLIPYSSNICPALVKNSSGSAKSATSANASSLTLTECPCSCAITFWISASVGF